MNSSPHVCRVFSFSLKSGQFQFVAIVVAILKMVAILKILYTFPWRDLFMCQIWLRTLKQCSGYKVSNFCSISLKVMTLTFLKMQFAGYFWGHRWIRHIMFALYINFRWNPGKVSLSAFWWPFWKSQPNWKLRKFRKHPSCRNLFVCQIWLRTLRQCSG